LQDPAVAWPGHLSSSAAHVTNLVVTVNESDPRFAHISLAHPQLNSTEPLLATSRLAGAMARAQLRRGGAIGETLRTGLPVIVTPTDRADRYPWLLPLAAEHDVRYQLAVPLIWQDRPVGALSVYSTREREIDVSTLTTAQSLAAQAVIVIEQDRHIANLYQAMRTREHIGQACGILMSRYLLTAEDAITALRVASQNRNVKVRDLAVEITETGALAELG
jgi:GAF domain-containing protein